MTMSAGGMNRAPRDGSGCARARCIRRRRRRWGAMILLVRSLPGTRFEIWMQADASDWRLWFSGSKLGSKSGIWPDDQGRLLKVRSMSGLGKWGSDCRCWVDLWICTPWNRKDCRFVFFSSAKCPMVGLIDDEMLQRPLSHTDGFWDFIDAPISLSCASCMKMQLPRTAKNFREWSWR